MTPFQRPFQRPPKKPSNALPTLSTHPSFHPPRTPPESGRTLEGGGGVGTPPQRLPDMEGEQARRLAGCNPVLPDEPKRKPMTDIISTADKLACVQRELALRQRVYVKWVEGGRMSAGKAAHEIACMEAIVQDYVAAAKGERLV
jgi:hypothetical protein